MSDTNAVLFQLIRGTNLIVEPPAQTATSGRGQATPPSNIATPPAKMWGGEISTYCKSSQQKLQNAPRKLLPRIVQFEKTALLLNFGLRYDPNLNEGFF